MKQNSTYEGAGERLDSYISRMQVCCSRAQVKRAVDGGRVTVNGSVCTKAARKLQNRDVVEWDLPDPDDGAPPKAEAGVAFGLLYEDEHLLVVNKPSGLVVHPGAGNPDGTLINGILLRYPEIAHVGAPDRPGIVHRLDAETSGLLLVARSQTAYESLVPMFAEHRIRRQYWAICMAPRLPGSGRFDTPYGRHPAQRVKFSSRFDAPRRAVTDFRVECRNGGGYALVTCLLQTGRTHQVRVHLSENGAPILGDPLYAPQNVMKNKYIQRLALHAGMLAFAHPMTGEPCEFRAPFPKDFAHALDALRLNCEQE